MAFSLKLPAGESGELILSYPSYSGHYLQADIMNLVYHKIYYLTPALFWEGDAKVHLEFRLPRGSYAMNSNIPMERHEPGIYRSTLEEIPEEEWMVTYTSTSWLIFGSNYRTVHNRFVGAMMILTLLISGYLTKKKDARFIWLSILTIPMFFLIRVRGLGGVVLYMMFLPILAILILWGLIALYKSFKKRFLSEGYGN